MAKEDKWAYVKYKEGTFLDKHGTISRQQIDHDFTAKPLDRRTKYFVYDPSGARVRAQVFFFEESEEMIKAQLEKASRRDMALKTIATASEDEGIGNNSSGKTKQVSADAAKKKEDRLKKYTSIKDMQKSNLKKSFRDEKENEIKCSTNENESTQKRKKSVVNDGSLPTPAKVRKVPVVNESIASTSTAQAVLHPEKPIVCCTKPNTLINVNDTSLPNDEAESSQLNSTGTSAACDSEKLEEVSTSGTSLFAHKNKSSLCTGDSAKKLDDKLDSESSAKKSKTNKIRHTSILKSENKLAKIEKENRKLITKNESLQKRLKELEAENKKVKDLNFRLQSTVIDKFSEQSVIEQQIMASSSNATVGSISHKLSFTPVGFELKGEKKIHIGRGSYIDSVTYYNLIQKSKTPYQCVPNVVKSLFDPQVLHNSTVTGKPSNRTLGKKEKKNAPVTKPEALDSKTLVKCKDFYDHWLETVYKPKLSGEDLDNYNYKDLLDSFDKFASKALSYLKRSINTKTKTSNDDRNSDVNAVEEENDEPGEVAKEGRKEAAKDNNEELEHINVVDEKLSESDLWSDPGDDPLRDLPVFSPNPTDDLETDEEADPLSVKSASSLPTTEDEK